MELSQYMIDFFELFFPKCCASCGTGLNSVEKAICMHCKYSFDRLETHDMPDNEVEKRFWGKVKIDAATSYARLVKNGLLERAIYDLKYRDNKDVGIELGQELGYMLRSSERFNSIDLIIPVPLHRKKKRRRGFNQCDLIAEGLSRVIDVGWSNEFLKRRIHNRSQTGKATFFRSVNTQGIFSVSNEEYLENKRVLLVDDVITTGATLESCIKAIEFIKGIRIFVATIASA